MHTIWQPTFTCKHSCPSCYLAGGELATENNGEDFPVIPKDTTQLTLSLDARPNYTGRQAIQHIINSKPDADVYITFRNELYALSWLQGYLNTFLNTVVLSDINDEQPFNYLLDYLRASRIHVGFNLLAGEEEKPSLLKLLHRFDFVYLILRKPKLGGMVREKDIYQWFRTRDKLESAGIKYVQDRCIENGYAVATGAQEGCHAGIHIRTIWPSGEVTGCPYNSNGLNEGKNACSICDIPSAFQRYWKKIK